MIRDSLGDIIFAVFGFMSFLGILAMEFLPSPLEAQEPQQVSIQEFRALQKEVADIRRRIGLVYTSGGEIFQEGEAGITAGQFHEAKGTSKLAGGVDTVTLNNAPAGNLADVTFKTDSSYWGTAWPVNTGVNNYYKLVPIAGNKFCIESSDSNDTNTVRWRVEGE